MDNGETKCICGYPIYLHEVCPCCGKEYKLKKATLMTPDEITRHALRLLKPAAQDLPEYI